MQITYAKIKELGPCYDPTKYIPDSWSGSLIDILNMKNVAAKDRLWVCVRHQFLTDKQIHAYGLACARQSEKNSLDPRVKACNDTVEAYLKGEATLEQLNAAESAAWSAAAWSAAESAWSAAESAARSAAESAESAARSAWSAARSAWSAAESAESAAESAAWSAAESAESAAESAAEEEQCQFLIKILETYE